MSTMLIQSETLSDIADAIREKLGVSDEYLPSEMPEAISSITGGGGGGGGGDWDMSSPLYSLFKVNSTQTSVYTAETEQRVLVLNSEVIDEANFAHNSRAIVTTTGNVIRSVIQSTTHNDTTKTRDTETQLALIDLQIGDTVTIENSAVTSHVNKTHLIWDGADIEDIANEFYDAIVDSARDNTKTISTDLPTSHMLWCQQVSGSNDNLNAAITVSSGTMSSVYIANETRNKIDAKIVKGPAVATYSTAAANDYTSKIYGVWSLVISDKSEKVPLITRSEWDALSISAKKAYDLVAIEDYISGFNRGQLVNGSAYVPDPLIAGAYSMNAGTAGSLTHTFDAPGKYTVFICKVMGGVELKPLSSIAVTLNGVAVDNITYEHPESNNNVGMNIYKFDVVANANDVLTVQNVSTLDNCGLQLFVIGNVSGVEFYNSQPNNNATFLITLYPSYYLQVHHMGYYQGRNNYSYEVSNEDGTSIPTPNETEYWYGGTYVIKLLQEQIQPIPEPSILFGATAPESSLGSNGDYYYTRIKEPSVCVPYWDNRQSSNTSISGYEFVTAAECDAVGLRVFNRSSSRTVTAGLYNENGTVIEEVTGEAISNDWTTLLFTTRRRLQSGTKYLSIANWGETGHAVYRSTYTIATDSRIVNTSLKGRYNGVPGTVDNDNIYGCDVLLDTAGESYYLIKEQYIKENGVWVKIS